MTPDPLEPFDPTTSRRRFLQVGAVGAFICTIGGKDISLSRAGDAAKADAAARTVKRPPLAGGRRPTARAAAAATPKGRTPEPTESQTYVTPSPQPGGRAVEYWIQATTVKWTVVPTERDDWHDVKIPGPSTFTATVYQQMTEGFAAPFGPAAIPGPRLHAEVGDTLVVHFRNNITGKLAQPVTMHPHGVKYNPEYDGVFIGDYTRAGGFIDSGEEFTYTWECVPEAVGTWPYHDHGPNHTLNTFRGLFGSLTIRERGDPGPDAEQVLFMHQLQPPVTGLKRAYQCFNGRAYAGNTPIVRAKVGQDVAIHIIGMDNNFHDFHIHGHRWKDEAGAFVDTPSVGPNETITARFVEDNPGRWLYHCHVFAHQDGGMAGWYLVE
ncbi:multicopper oxidase domain-containing protein [Conexibacter woesei]|uniref:multicopper oxidase domain-containing protein n=1 Tax=Conexibacter woesei TaxID=191495 RepID=UPI000412F664|nr:multicopper oxidase domain-containing protein [Conexibacter woesei]